MIFYNLFLITESKNKKSIFYFELVLIRFFIHILVKNKKSFKNIFKFTLLRSPHVHKSAQHEFKQQIYKKQYLFSNLNSTELISLKKLFTHYFQDIKKNFIFLPFHKKTFFNCKTLKINNFELELILTNKTSYFIEFCYQQKSHHKFDKLKNYLKLLYFKGENLI